MRVGAAACRRGLPMLLLALLGSAPATALQVALTPEAPTWFDPVRLVVAATRWTCGSFRLGEASFFLQPDGVIRIELPLEEICPPGLPDAPPVLRQLEASKDFGRLDPGRYLLRLVDPAGPVPDRPFTVHDPADHRLELPVLATDAAPGALRVQWLYTSYFGTEPTVSVRVEGPTIEVLVETHAPSPEITPAPPTRRLVEATLPLPSLAAGDYEVRVIGTGTGPPGALVTGQLRVWRSDGCLPSPDALCLQHGRFRVAGTWRTSRGPTGTVHSQPLPGSDESGLLWFFDPSNVELSVKALDGCGVNGHWWLFLASGSNVEYDIRVTDTATGAVRTYANPLGTLPPLVADTSAFACDG